jgi:hypothetical protein
MDNAKQTIWHQAYIRALETITSLRNHCDFTFTRDSKNAKEVKILGAVRPEVRAYVPGTPITRDAVSSTAQTLTIDQFKYFNIGIDDVIKAQTVPGAMEAEAKEGAAALAEAGDAYVASIVKTAADGGDIGTIATAAITKTNAVEKVEDAFVILYGNNVRANENFHLEVSPNYYSKLRQSLTELFTDNVEMAKKGYVGKYGNALVSIENLLPHGGGAMYNILRTTKAVAFVEQIDKVEAYRPEDAFEDALKGLYTFGAKIVRPKEIVVIKEAYEEPSA